MTAEAAIATATPAAVHRSLREAQRDRVGAGAGGAGLATGGAPEVGAGNGGIEIGATGLVGPPETGMDGCADTGA